jgi:hypothetical protein
MSEQLNAPSQVSIGNSLAAPEFASDTGFTNAPVWRDFESMAIVPTGEQQPLDFLNEPYDPSWPEPKKNRWEEYNFGEVATTPAAAAQRTLADMEAERKRAATMQDEQMKAQRERELAASDPAARADLAAKQADAASKQLGLQDAYLQEMEYQSHLNTVMNSGASRAERQAAISAIDGLATAIGKRTMGAGAGSRDAMQAGKKAVGFIDWKREYNPINMAANALGANWNADYTPQVDVMRRGSENRIGAIRQQMEAAGVPVPEFKGAPPPPEPNQIVVKQFGMKREDGTPITFRGAPVIRTAEGGKEVYERLGTDGKFYTLTEKEITELTGGQ